MPSTNRKILSHPQLLPKAGLLHAFVISPELFTYVDQHSRGSIPLVH